MTSTEPNSLTTGSKTEWFEAVRRWLSYVRPEAVNCLATKQWFEGCKSSATAGLYGHVLGAPHSQPEHDNSFFSLAAFKAREREIGAWDQNMCMKLAVCIDYFTMKPDLPSCL